MRRRLRPRREPNLGSGWLIAVNVLGAGFRASVPPPAGVEGIVAGTLAPISGRCTSKARRWRRDEYLVALFEADAAPCPVPCALCSDSQLLAKDWQPPLNC